MARKISDAVKEYMAKNKQLNLFDDFDIDSVIIKFKNKQTKEKPDDKEKK